jgi:hypothetical protein
MLHKFDTEGSVAACFNHTCPDRPTCQRARLLEQPVEPFLAAHFTRKGAPDYDCYLEVKEEAA